MGLSIFITGTNTGVGKTFFSYLLAKGLQKLGLRVGYWKPVETGADPIPQDAKLLATLLGEKIEEVVSYTFKMTLAPAVAEIYEGEKIKLKRLKEIYKSKLPKYDLLIVEGAGGLAVPIKNEFTFGDFAKELNLPVVIVSDAQLGTINCSFLTAFYGKSLKLNLLGFVFNRFTGKDFSEKDNPRVVEEMTGLPVWFKIPQTKLESYSLEKEKLKKFLKILEENLKG